jgi:translation elongation factor EF-G
LAPTPIVASAPRVALRETVTIESPRAFLGKSSNKHNRVFARAAPADAALVAALDDCDTDQVCGCFSTVIVVVIVYTMCRLVAM